MDRDTDVKEMMAMMLAAERWDIRDVRNRFGGYPDAVLGLMVHEAIERVRLDHDVHFGVMPQHPGTYERKDVTAISDNAGRQRRRGYRALERAAQKLELAAKRSAEQTERERFERSAARLRERLAWAKSRQEAKP